MAVGVLFWWLQADGGYYPHNNNGVVSPEPKSFAPLDPANRQVYRAKHGDFQSWLGKSAYRETTVAVSASGTVTNTAEDAPQPRPRPATATLMEATATTTATATATSTAHTTATSHRQRRFTPGRLKVLSSSSPQIYFYQQFLKPEELIALRAFVLRCSAGKRTFELFQDDENDNDGYNDSDCGDDAATTVEAQDALASVRRRIFAQTKVGGAYTCLLHCSRAVCWFHLYQRCALSFHAAAPHTDLAKACASDRILLLACV